MSRLKTLITALLLLGVGVFAPVRLRAVVEDLGAGARAPGMANAFVGVADDVNALLTNPAGLTQIEESQVSVEHSDLLGGLDDGSALTATYLGYAQPLPHNRGTVGVAWHSFNSANLVTDRTLALSYAQKLRLQPFGWRGQWSVGGSLKQLRRTFASDAYTQNARDNSGTTTGQTDPLFANHGYEKTAYALDMSVFTRFGEGLRHSAGLVLTNINRPSLSLSGSGDKPPLLTKLGLATKPHWGVLSAEVRRGERLAGQTDTDFAVGAERLFKLENFGALGIRGGLAEGSRGLREMTAGMSVQFHNTTLDYAFSIPMGNLSGMGAAQRIGLTFKFNGLKELDDTKKAKEISISTGSALKSEEQGLPSRRSSAERFENLAGRLNQALGRYFAKLNDGASLEERLQMLLAIMETYENMGLNLNLVEQELGIVQSELNMKPVPTPTVTPAAPSVAPAPKPKTAPPAQKSPVKVKPVLTPAPIVPTSDTAQSIVEESTKFDQAWRYYIQAVQRGLSDRERIEVLEGIKRKFGSQGLERLQPELDRVRNRAQ